MLEKWKDYLSGVIFHHAGLEEKEAVMHRIEILLQTARSLRDAFDTAYHVNPKAPEMVARVRIFHEDGIVLAKHLRRAWFLLARSAEWLELLREFYEDFSRFPNADFYEASSFNIAGAERFASHLDRLIVFLLQLS